MKRFGIHNTLKKKDLKSFYFLPSISLGYYRSSTGRCLLIHFHFLNIWIYYKKIIKNKDE